MARTSPDTGIVKLFMHGRSQAVRLPLAFRLPGDRVRVFELLNARHRVGNMTPVIYGVPGLAPKEIASIEAQLGFQLPADFAYLFHIFEIPGASSSHGRNSANKNMTTAFAGFLKG